MLGIITSCTLNGVDAVPITIEVAIQAGLPGYHVVGLPAASVKEGGLRIRAALKHVGLELPKKRIVVNMAPADLRKDGSAFDLPIALGILVADGLLPPDQLRRLMVIGELGLDGAVRSVRGALSAAILAASVGTQGIIVPGECAPEAAAVESIAVYGVDHLKSLIDTLRDGAELARTESAQWTPRLDASKGLGDMSEVRGQQAARTALEVAVAGGHNLLMVGPPGIGKTMLARRIPTILPPLTFPEALETTRVHSTVGLTSGGLVRERPFRAPHHSVSTAALVGGGTIPKAGEVSLAHNGVLFLDELPEFSRGALESLRQPLEDRQVTICRVHGSITLPASFLLVASANPCPCGFLGSSIRQCTDGTAALQRYQHRLSGPLMNRIDLQINVPNVTIEELRASEPSPSSATIRARVVEARQRQLRRLSEFGVRTNAELPPKALRLTCKLTDNAEKLLTRLAHSGSGFTGRSIDRIIKVARTIADLDGDDIISRGCILEAVSFRSLDGGSALARQVPALPCATAQPR